jgi:hypothetical protein
VLGISLRTGVFSCWVCGVVRPGDTLALLAKITLPEALSLLKGARIRPGAIDPRPRGTFRPPIGIGPMLAAHRQYLRGRGFEHVDQLSKLWGLGGIGRSPEYAWRVYAPVRLHGEAVSWTTRAVGAAAHGARYRSAPADREALPIKSVVYGNEYVRHSVVVVEGPADAWAGGPGFAALLGAAATKAQVRFLAGVPRRAVCFDAEPEARRRAEALCADLAPLGGVTDLIQLDHGADPADCLKTKAGRRELARLRRIYLEDC